MTGLTVHTSNRLEILADHLAAGFRRPPENPLVPDCVVVQSRGMARWLSLEIARRNRICAHVAFPFPGAFLDELSAQLIARNPSADGFDPDTLTLRVYEHLSAGTADPAFTALRDYLQGDVTGLKRYQLCRQIAVMFDQYQIFRPNWLLDWERGRRPPDARFQWQPHLWRILSGESGGNHRARRYRDLLEALERLREKPAGWPDRVSVFGISYLPPVYLEIFSALGRVQKMDLYLLNPCREFWGDIVSGAEAERMKRRYASAADGQPSGVREENGSWLHLEAGNRLLASMGGQGREFLGLIQSFDMQLSESFADVGRDTRLHRLQRDILNLVDPTTPGADPAALDGEGDRPAAGPDDSIRIHACHSPMREVEVLYDQLLSLFEDIPDLHPRDILVMTSDIEVYAPYIEAVFGTQPDPRKQIPFRVADRPRIAGNRVADGFLQMLRAGGHRQGVSDVLALLENEAVAGRFDITAPDLAKIREWIYGAGIRWGVDSNDLSAQGLPAFGENTWKAGLDRMLLGYALGGGPNDLFDGILPFDAAEGSDTVIMDRLIRFLDRFFVHLKSIKKPNILNDWIDISNKILEEMFDQTPRVETEAQVIRNALDERQRAARRAGSTREMEPAAFRAMIGEQLEGAPLSSGFMAGGVTFCAMLPMRSIPFRVIGLLGMNSGEFPREDRRPGFDLTAGDPRPGDRSRRNDDKYLFLEALISARDVLYISYVGRSEQDNADRPPSVLVSELIDYLREGSPAAGGLRVVRHRRHPFSPEYYRAGSRLFSYDPDNVRAGRRLSQPASPQPFIVSHQPWPSDTKWQTIDLDTLCRFFGNPARYFLRRRLGVHIRPPAAPLPDRENFSLTGLDRFRLEQKIVTAKRDGVPRDRLLEICRETGLLPHGVVGDVAFFRADIAAFEFLEKTRSVSPAGTPETVEMNAVFGDLRLTGRVDGVCPDGWMTLRYARQRPVDLLWAWIRHLALCSRAGAGEFQTVLCGKDRYARFRNPADAPAVLESLLGCYRSGICAPLPFFPKSAMVYMKQMQKKPAVEADARRAAQNAWEGNDFQAGESADPDFQRCFDAVSPIDDRFAEVSRQVYGPMLAHMTDRKW